MDMPGEYFVHPADRTAGFLPCHGFRTVADSEKFSEVMACFLLQAPLLCGALF
jgi:hypothetical protein